MWHTSLARNTLETFGFTINLEKSTLVPSQTCDFLGFAVDSRRMCLFIPHRKRLHLEQEVRDLLAVTGHGGSITLRRLAAFLGRANAMGPALRHHQFFRHGMLDVLRAMLRGSENGDPWIRQVTLTSEALSEVEWWLTCLRHWNGRSLLHPPPEIRIQSDASGTNWGAHCLGQAARGFFTPSERLLSNNGRELSAAVHAVLAFCRAAPRGSVVLLQTGNVTTAAYINRGGGRPRRFTES